MRKILLIVSSLAALASLLLSCRTASAPTVAATSPPPTASGVSATLAATIAARLDVQPANLVLESRRATRQFVVLADVDGESRDVTHLATFRSSNDKTVHIEHGLASPVGDGRTTITVEWGGKRVEVPATVANFSQPDPVLFKFETMAVFTKQGCAGGSCHGSPQGKAGFSLSLFGYDPTIDRRSLTRDGFSRRIDSVEPAWSLILRKPLMELDHVGGKKLHKDDAPYRTLLAWIAEGANTALPAVECVNLTVHPGPDRVLKAPALTQQLSVLAHFSDGRVRDVTAIAAYDTSSREIATVDADGRVTGRGRGQAAISVRYLSQLQSVNFTVIEEVPNFVWKAPPEVNFVDTLVNAKLMQLKFLPAETCDDATFIRRVHLDLTGLIPTGDEARRFIESKDPQKRSKVVDTLLDSEAFARFWALKRADLMRVSSTRLRDGRAEKFSDWLVNVERTDMPYDQFARQLLTATGNTLDVPEASFFLAVPKPEERTEMTAQLFLGSRLECTKCHNHPYEKWTMNDYYSLSAVFARTASDQGIITKADTGETVHPMSKKAMLPWGSTAATPPDADRRGPFVGWLTAPDNPLFARVEVNRIWSHLFGRGIVEPVDDFRSSNPPANGPLLDALAKAFVEGGYRRKAIIRLICNSQTYQRAVAANEFNAADETLFSHARPRLLTAEQIRDAVGLAAGTLAPLNVTPEQLARDATELAQRRAELAPGFDAWLARASAEAAALDFWAAGWHAVGPFSIDPNDEQSTDAFAPELTPVDFAASFDGGKRQWRPRPEWNTPSATYTMDTPKDSTIYIAREIYSREARDFPVDLTANGKLWLNGQPVKATLKGEKIAVLFPLAAGRNVILLKLVGKQDEAAFRFNFDQRNAATEDGPELLPQVVGLLAKPLAQLTAAERQTIRDYYPQMDASYAEMLRRQAYRPSNADFATQRPVPVADPFMAAFGQPKRESACACERVTAPTLLQALELLNGATLHSCVQEGASRYARLTDGELLDSLYLAALARFPSAAELDTARKFVAAAPNRDEAVMDLLWSALNTREFLFQH
jgi:hypothetical protein